MLLALVGVILFRTAWMADDAFITLRTIDNFVHGYGLRWNIEERVQSFTHPLWLLLQIPIYFATRNAFATGLTLSLACSGLTVWLFATRFGSVAAGCAGLVVLASSRAFIDYSTSGLENPLTHLLLLLFALTLRVPREREDRYLRLSLIAGLAALNRLDTILLFLPSLVLEVRSIRMRAALRALALGGAPPLLWMIFSTLYYGFPLPNTATAKLGVDLGAGALLQQAGFYFLDSLRRDPATLPLTLLGFGIGILRGGIARALALGGLFYLAYVASIGGDFMSGRFLAAPFLVAVIALVETEFFAIRSGALAIGAAAVLLSFLAPMPPILCGRDYGLAGHRRFGVHGIADERSFYFGRSGLFSLSPPNRKPSAESTRVGDLARTSEARVLVEYAIGFTGFAAGPKVHVIDTNALADAFLARLPMTDQDPIYKVLLEQQLRKKPATSWRIGHFARALPKGYLATIAGGRNLIEDGNLARYYDTLQLVTRGPLWSLNRFAHIARFNLGRYDFLVDRESLRAYRPVDYGEVLRFRPKDAEALFRRALSRLESGDTGGANADLSKALEQCPTHWSALDLSALLAERDGRGDDAVAFWNAAIAAAPNQSTPHLGLAGFLSNRGQPAEAAEHYRGALALDPYSSEAADGLGFSLRDLGRPRDAIPWLERSLKIRGPSGTGYLNVGLALLESGDPEAALRLLERALDASPDDPIVLMNAGAAFLSLHQTPRALPLLERAAALSPEDPEAWYQLAQGRAASGDRARASEAMQKAAALGYSPAIEALQQR